LKVVFFCSEDESLGVGYLSAYLKKNGHQAELVFDPRLFTQRRILSGIFNVERENLKKIKRMQPDLIGFSVVTSNYQWALRMAGFIKENMDVPIIFGGIHPTMVPDATIVNDAIDMVCVGEGEEALLELVNSIERGEIDYAIKNIWFKKDGRIIKNDVRPLVEDLDSLPFPDKPLFYDELPFNYARYTSCMASRGCIFTCTYCAQPYLRKLYHGKGRYHRRRSVEKVIEELEQMKRRYGTRYIFFFDDLFITDIKWLKEFAQKFKKRVNIPFSCFSHPSLVTEEAVHLLKEAGCNLLMIGVQCGSEALRKKVLKRFEPNKHIIQAAEFCKKAGLRFSVDHIIDLPYEEEEDLIQSLNLYNKIRPNVVNVYKLIYFPGTEIVQMGKRAGLLNDEAERIINEGKSSGYGHFLFSPTEKSLRSDNYRKYALLFSLIPLLPRRLVGFMINRSPWRLFIGKLPMPLVSLVKTISNLKAGLGFLPAIVLYYQLHFGVTILKQKIGNLLARE